MSEHPILFSGPMVRAILEGRKTQTRRLATHRHGIHFLGGAGEENDPSYARAEGCKTEDAFILYERGEDGVLKTSEMQRTARGAFAVLWDSINAKRAPWASSPWVWAVSFEVAR